MISIQPLQLGHWPTLPGRCARTHPLPWHQAGSGLGLVTSSSPAGTYYVTATALLSLAFGDTGGFSDILRQGLML